MADHRRRKTESSAPDPVHGLFDALFRGLWWLVSYPFRDKNKETAKQRARQQFWAHWKNIEGLASAGQAREAIMQADILLGQALEFAGAAGGTVGEQLKAMQGKLDRNVLDTAWNAHKVRNNLAHQLNYQLSPTEARQTLNDFQKTFRSLGL